MTLKNRLQILVEQEIGSEIPEFLEIYCPICKKEEKCKYLGIEDYDNNTLILYNCLKCDDTVSIRPKELKSKLLKLVA